MYSDRNNRPAELRGIIFSTIHNLDNFRFITTSRDIPVLHLQSRNDTHAHFIHVQYVEPIVIPQNHSLNLVGEGLLTLMKVEGCPFPIFETSAAVINPINDLVFELRFLSTSGNVFTLQTQPHCQLRLLKLSRTIAIRSKALRKHFKYGITPEHFGGTWIAFTGSTVHSPVSETNFIETLSEFPDLHFHKFWMFQAHFEYINYSLLPFIIPSRLPLVVHTTTESRRRDIVILKFVCLSECEINLFHSKNGDWIPSRLKAFYMKRSKSKTLVEITYQRHILNAKFEIGTQFQILASCPLFVSQLTRQLKMSLPFELRTEATHMALSAEDIS